MEFAMTPTLVHHFLEQSAARAPEKTALVCGEQRIRYAELLQRSLRLAAALHALGVRRHDRVVVFCDNSVDAVTAFFGTLAAGAAVVMLHAGMKGRKLAFILGDSGTEVVIAGSSHAAVVREAVAESPRVRHVLWTGTSAAPLPSLATAVETHRLEEALSAAPPAAAPGTIDVDLAAIIYTSGSTGEPKGVMSTHANMVAATRSISTYLRITADDIVLNSLPLSFDYGLYQLLMVTLFGGTLVLEPSFTFPVRVLERLVRERVTGFPIVPTLAALLLQMQDLGRFDLGCLRFITNTAAALPVPHIRRLIELFPRARIYSMYGLTECKRVAYMPPERLAERPGSVGIPMPNCEVFVVDDEGREVGPDHVGELVVRGANVMQGYWNRPEETARRFRAGRWRSDALLYSGDLFRRDAEGFLYFVARKDDMIKTKGERVSPKEIENALCEMAGVAEAAVVGVADDLLGQAVKAYIIAAGPEPPTEAAVLAHCRRHLESFMVPREIVFRDTFPRTATGKIDKKSLG
jgi:amino acid adenylation domain-containing protein